MDYREQYWTNLEFESVNHKTDLYINILSYELSTQSSVIIFSKRKKNPIITDYIHIVIGGAASGSNNHISSKGLSSKYLLFSIIIHLLLYWNILRVIAFFDFLYS